MSSGRSKNSDHDQSPKFLTLGGNPVLDFCNTLLIHNGRRDDRLLTARDAQSFFTVFFRQKLSLTKKQFSTILHLRFCFRDYFSSVVQKKPNIGSGSPLADFLESVKLVLEWNTKDKTFSKLSVVDNKGKYLQPIISEFFEFNRNFHIERIRECANENCSHLFYDASKNNTRVWCDMKSCGNIHKARSFQARSKK